MNVAHPKLWTRFSSSSSPSHHFHTHTEEKTCQRHQTDISSRETFLSGEGQADQPENRYLQAYNRDLKKCCSRRKNVCQL